MINNVLLYFIFLLGDVYYYITRLELLFIIRIHSLIMADRRCSSNVGTVEQHSLPFGYRSQRDH